MGVAIKRGLMGLVALASSACIVQTGFFPENTVAFNPPEYYKTIWKDVEYCVGKKRKFNDITWKFIPDVGNFYCEWEEGGVRESSNYCRGLYLSSGIIVLAGKDTNTTWILEHEMAHAITKDVQHISPEFKRCVRGP
jgi:hypothetical protein